ncbi:MAG: adenylate/guanylate cyclase domain-containing protein [Paracoccaceae bacterium]
MIDTFKFDAVVNWLLAGAPPKAPLNDTIAELSRRLIAAGLPVDILELYLITINPMIMGSVYFWTKGKGAQVLRFTHAQMASDLHVGTVQHSVIETGRMIRVRMDTASPFDANAFIQTKRSRGYTDYIMCPLFGRFTPNSAFALGTKRAGGFTDDEITAFRRLQTPIAHFTETEILYQNTVTMLSTYVGRGAGEQVMNGRILRGHAENITAVILFADLRNFTALSNSLPPERIIATLNTYFEAMDSAIRANGGETLKFIGDGLLAIFPTVDELTAQAAAAMGAISALDDARAALAAEAAEAAGAPEIDFRAALHLGDIHYGNIGSATRLDFTAVGPAVNLTSRLLLASAELGAPTVCSDAFAPLARLRCAPARVFEFKGFAEPVMVHTVV